MSAPPTPSPGKRPQARAVRAIATGAVQGVGLRAAVQREAIGLEVVGWVRNQPDGTVAVHAEGAPEAVEALLAYLHGDRPPVSVNDLQVVEVKVEGHEQFAIRGVSAGAFAVLRREDERVRFELQLEVAGAMRVWDLAKEPSLDPSVKRMAIERTDVNRSIEQTAPTWDRGDYEQGGRVPWPQALDRGHAVFVLHGSKLRGGFALQRIRPGEAAQWLLIKRRDEFARDRIAHV